MAKVGILTMQRIMNYGSFLQAYGLKMILEELGHDVEFVDYRKGQPLLTERRKFLNISTNVKKVMSIFFYQARLLHKIHYILYKKKFKKKYFSLLGIQNEMNFTPQLDILIIGSDEVFNCIQKNSNVGYSLELFGKNNRAKKLISYAASFGNTTLKKLQFYGKDSEIGNLLNAFNAISVRDSNSGYIVKTLTGINPEFNLDPVLAYEYLNKCKLIPNIKVKEKYLILYAYAGRISSQEANWILQYARKKGLKIYTIGGIHKYADKFIDCTPFEVLAYFKNAESVITDTFHGTIFSVITKKKFATIIRKSVGNSYGNEEKITDLLKRIGLNDRLTMNVQSIEAILDKNINYINVDNFLEEERIHSRKYLKEHTMI